MQTLLKQVQSQHQLTRMHCTQYRDLVVTLDPRSGVRRIRIAVPRRKNAIRLDTYRHLAEALREADDDPDTKITLLTGTLYRDALKGGPQVP